MNENEILESLKEEDIIFIAQEVFMLRKNEGNNFSENNIVNYILQNFKRDSSYENTYAREFGEIYAYWYFSNASDAFKKIVKPRFKKSNIDLNIINLRIKALNNLKKLNNNPFVAATLGVLTENNSLWVDNDARMLNSFLSQLKNVPDVAMTTPNEEVREFAARTIMDEVLGDEYAEHRQKATDIIEKDSALLVNNLGGIDLTPDQLPLETRGSSIEMFDGAFFGLPCLEENESGACVQVDMQALETMPFSGFSPTIFQVVPVKSLPIFLGVVE